MPSSSWLRRPADLPLLRPAFRPDGSADALRLQRLRRTRTAPMPERSRVRGAYALPVGDEGAGVRTIIQMVQLTRLDCGLASTGFMRMALAQAVHDCRYRSVFQRHLYDQPMMRVVLSDLALEVEGAVALIMRLARAFDLAASDPREAAFAGFSRRRRSTGYARRRRASSMRPWNASAATATSRKASCRSFIGKRPSMRSGKARAT